MNSENETPPTHPGAILSAELAELALSPTEFDSALALPAGAAEELLAQRSGVTAELALRLGRYFGTTPRFWMDMQDAPRRMDRGTQARRNHRRPNHSPHYP